MPADAKTVIRLFYLLSTGETEPSYGADLKDVLDLEQVAHLLGVTFTNCDLEMMDINARGTGGDCNLVLDVGSEKNCNIVSNKHESENNIENLETSIALQTFKEDLMSAEIGDDIENMEIIINARSSS